MTGIDWVLSKVVPEPNSGCWLWLGSTTGDNGYGILTKNGRRQLAHRQVYREVFGGFDETLFVCHKCNVKPCCNPHHLYLATNSQNIADAYRDGLIKHANSKKPDCPLCHSPFQIDCRGQRFCRKCRTKNNTMHRSQKRKIARAARGAK